MATKFSRRALAYYQDGRRIGAAREQEILEAIIAAQRGRTDVLIEQVASGEITVEQWENRMRAALKEAHLQAALLGRGGELTLTSRGRLGGILRGQYSYLSKWAAALLAKSPDATPSAIAMLQRRAGLYLKAIRRQYYAARGEAAIRAGFTHKRKILMPGESCDDCKAQAALGWVPIDDSRVTDPGVGTVCQVNCNCIMKYKRIQ